MGSITPRSFRSLFAKVDVYSKFCIALCDQTVENHAGSHATKIYRFNCMNSWRCSETDLLNTDICTTRVADEPENSKVQKQKLQIGK